MQQRRIDPRGYAGGERNRQIEPKDVIWARQAYHNGEVTTRQLSVMFGMGVESVRRMLRGDSYANVGEALPREQDARMTDAEPSPEFLASIQKGLEVKEEAAEAKEKSTHDAAIDQYLGFKPDRDDPFAPNPGSESV